jgi:hypothetical protein
VIGNQSGAAGTFYSDLIFRNHGSASCEMTGYPGVSFLDASGAEINVPATRSGAAYASVTVAPGASVDAQLAMPDPDVRDCPTAIAHSVRVFPPNETHALLITVDDSNSSGVANGIRVCARGTPPAEVAPIVRTPA